MEYRSDFIFSTWKSILITWQSKGTSSLLKQQHSFLPQLVAPFCHFNENNSRAEKTHLKGAQMTSVLTFVVVSPSCEKAR